MFEIIFQFYYHIYFEILDNIYILFMNIKFIKLKNIFEKYLLGNICSKFIIIVSSKN